MAIRKTDIERAVAESIDKQVSSVEKIIDEEIRLRFEEERTVAVVLMERISQPAKDVLTSKYQNAGWSIKFSGSGFRTVAIIE